MTTQDTYTGVEDVGELQLLDLPGVPDLNFGRLRSSAIDTIRSVKQFVIKALQDAPCGLEERGELDTMPQDELVITVRTRNNSMMACPSDIDDEVWNYFESKMHKAIVAHPLFICYLKSDFDYTFVYYCFRIAEADRQLAQTLFSTRPTAKQIEALFNKRKQRNAVET